MDINMALFTNRNNIKPMFSGVAFMVVIFFCLFAARAFESILAGKFASDNGIMNLIHSFYSFWELNSLVSCILSLGCLAGVGVPVSKMSLPVGGFASLALAVSLVVGFYFFSISFVVYFLKNRTAQLAVVSITIFAIFAFGKIRHWFCLVAFRALFCYDLLRHGFLQYRKLCLELATRPILVSSLFYYSLFIGGVK